jgi:hypothetical protein
MLEAFRAGGDFHSRTALNMYDEIRAAVDRGDVLLEWDMAQGRSRQPIVMARVEVAPRAFSRCFRWVAPPAFAVVSVGLRRALFAVPPDGLCCSFLPFSPFSRFLRHFRYPPIRDPCFAGPSPKPLLKERYGAERRQAKTLNFSIAYGKTSKYRRDISYGSAAASNDI